MTFILIFIGLIVAYHLIKFFVFHTRETTVPDLSKHGHMKELIEQRMQVRMKLFNETPREAYIKTCNESGITPLI